MYENPVLNEAAPIQVEEVVLPQIVSIKQASQRMGLPVYYVRRLCKEVPGIAFQSGVKWYINLGKMAEFINRQDIFQLLNRHKYIFILFILQMYMILFDSSRWIL